MNQLFPSSKVIGPDLFEAAWQEYPDRHVSENKRDALKQWLMRVREGVDEMEMVEGCERYALYCERLRIYGTEYVMQPRRFFGPSRHFEQDWKINGHKIQAREELSARTMTKLKQNEALALQPEEAKAMLASIRTGLRKA